MKDRRWRTGEVPMLGDCVRSLGGEMRIVVGFREIDSAPQARGHAPAMAMIAECHDLVSRANQSTAEQSEVRYADGNAAMVGDTVGFGAYRAVVRRFSEHPGYVELRGASSGVSEECHAGLLTLIARAAPDTIPAPAPDHVVIGARDTRTLPLRIAGTVSGPTGTKRFDNAPELYAAFDKRIRKVLTSVAPLARVVTDQVHANEEREESTLVTFLDAPKDEDGKNPFEFCFPLTMHIEKMELEFREILWTYLGTVGRRAMGGKR